jgi:putative FmdB family regulatory protein
MPLFEYKCQKCGHVMEVLQASHQPTKQTCAKCGGSDMKKLLSSFAVGQSKGPSPACDSCAAGPAFGGGCGGCGGACPMG